MNKIMEFIKRNCLNIHSPSKLTNSLVMWWKKEKILTASEKKYLRNFLKPLKTNQTCIKKHAYRDGKYEAITITLLKSADWGEKHIELPMFKAGTMYKGMKLYVYYPLDWLGL